MEMMSFKYKLLIELKRFFEPVLMLKTSEEVFIFLKISGWELQGVLGANSAEIVAQVQTIGNAVKIIVNISEEAENDDFEFIEIILATEKIILAIYELKNLLTSVLLVGAERLPVDILNTLFVIYINKYNPQITSLLKLLTLLREDENPVLRTADNEVYKDKSKILLIKWDVIPNLLNEPKEVFAEYYWPDGFDTVDITNQVAKLLLPPVAELFNALGFITALGYNGGSDDYSPEIRKRMESFLTAKKEFSLQNGIDTTAIGFTFGLVPKTEGGPGVILIPFGESAFSKIFKKWHLQANLTLAPAGMLINEDGVALLSNLSTEELSLRLLLTKLSEANGEALMIGSDEQSHFSVKYMAVRGELAVNSEKQHYGIYFLLTGAKLVIKGADGDGFISSILGEGLTAEFDIEIGYSNKNGFHFKGSGDLEIVLPKHISLGPIDINNLTLGIGAKNGFDLKAYSTIKLELGPFVAVIEGLGLKSQLSFPDGGGNLGPANLDFGFKPPTGIGLSLDASIVKGGGYIFFDPEKEQYGGALEIVIAEKISVVAIALITTRFPDGSKGFSLLLLISVEFSPGIALGMGFFLSGIGGMIGINRTVNADALREGVKQGAVDHILFPTDVVANIQRIITDLREFFPPQRDQFIIGLMAKITWGVPTLLSVEFGIVIEFTNPVRLVILGVVKLVLPTEDAAILKIQVNFIGIIDFNEGYLMFNASLFGSRILTFTLEGDMALRIFWGKEKEFLLSVGGFHPAYSPPAYLKVGSMTRLTINILSGNPSLTLTTYFAITSNTVQFGAMIDFQFKVSKFKVIGYFGFDVLFQFSPFHFIAVIHAGVKVKLGSRTLFSITLAFNLEGPTPWIANGTATFKVLFIKIKVKFSKTWGERREDILPGIAVLPKLIEALEQPRNWVGNLPSNKFLLTSMKKVDLLEGQVIMHAVGTLTIRQTVLPLSMEITKFGNYTPVDIKSAFISRITIAKIDSTFIDVKDAFAPAEYKEMEDNDKLKAPSYKDEISGIKITSTERLHVNYGINREVVYETIVSDYHRESESPYLLYHPLRKKPETDKLLHFKKMLRGGAIGRNELSKDLKIKNFRNDRAVTMQAEKFVITNLSDLSKMDLGSFNTGTKAEADDMLKRVIRANPSLKNKIQVIPEYELMKF
jgi:hypothetical protein